MSLTDEQEANLIIQAQQGNRQAFEQLYSAHEKQVYGYIRVRVDHDEDAKELAQETWLKIWQKITTYDPTRARFHAFAICWAKVMLLRYYAARGRRGRVERLLSELSVWFPNIQQEEEIADLLAGDTANSYASHSNHSVEEEAIDAQAYEDLVQRAFGGSSPPHQLIVFGFVKLLEWKPAQLVAEFSNTPLRALEDIFEQEYLEASHLPEEKVRAYFGRLRQSMDRTFDEVVGDPHTRKTYPALLGQIVGNTTLRSYYTGDPSANVTQWWDAVKRRVWNEITREEKLRRVASEASPPHQLIVFAFVALLGWKPERVVDKLSHMQLRAIEAMLEEEYRQKFQLAMDRVQSCCKRLRERLERRFEEAVDDAKMRQTHSFLVGHVAGDTTLRYYYKEKAADKQAIEVSEWCSALAKRLRSDG